jgi:hypothetical protein
LGVYDLFNPGFDGKLTLGDFNGDNNTEIYCTQYVPLIYFTPAKIFEFDPEINLNLVYTYPDSQTYALASYDIDSDGENEIIINTYASRGIYVYTKPSPNSYPTDLQFFFSIGPEYQVDHHTFCDADNDGLTDYIFASPPDSSWFKIYEYDSFENNFIQKYYGDKPVAGFIVYDFDLDGKNEIIGSDIYGKIVILECTGNDQYALSFELDTELYNAYQIFYTNDIDKNGYPEFWIGGNDFVNDSFKFICFESASDNYYKRVTSISIKYLGAYPYGYATARDFNNDGTEEIFIVFNEFIFILEFAGGPNYHNYNVMYYGIVKPENSFIYMDNVTVYDIFNRGKKEIIVSLLEGTQTNYFSRTYIYTNQIPTRVEDDLRIINNYYLFQNYPNPFNPITTIKYNLPEYSKVKLIVYDVLGNEITDLVNEDQPKGNYEVQFDGNGLSSGIYFYQLKANDFIKTKKLILIK